MLKVNKNCKIKLIYDTDESSYRVKYGYSSFLGILFEVDDSIYTVQSTKDIKEEEIPSYIQYLFDNIILINQ